MNRIYSILLILTAFTAVNAFGQNGSLSGKVTETIDGQIMAVPFANVAVIESLQGTTTNFDGEYSLANIKPGTYTLVISFIGYKPDSSSVTISAGENKTLNRTLGKNSEMLKEFEVVAKVNRESENILLLEQKNAAEIKQSIGSRELEKKGASDVATGLTKVTGISIAEGRSMFVRGLGDRYNLATWNGALIASPNPDQKVVPLDLFPTDIVSSLGIDKTFQPKYFADYAGARIDISSKDYPEDPFFKVELGTSMNTQTTFQDFEGRKTGKYEFLGYDGGNRDLPDQIASKNNNLYNTGNNENDAYPYTTNLNNNQYTAMPSTSIGISGGNFYKLKNDRAFGFLALANFDNKYQTKNGIDRVLKADRGIMTDYEYVSYQYTTSTTLYGNLYYKLNDKHSVSLNGLFINSSENNATTHNGFNNDQGVNLITSRNPYFQDKMYNVQMVGKHKFLAQDKLSVNWSGSYSQAGNVEKDRNQNVWLEDNSGNYRYNSLDAASNHRWWSELDETQMNANIDMDYKFKYISKDKDDSNQGKINFGFNYLDKERQSDWRQVNYIFNTADTSNPIIGSVDPNDRDATLNQGSYNANYFSLKEQRDASSFYIGEMNIMAGYASVDYFVIPDKLQLMAGVRMEKSNQTIRYKKLSDLYSAPMRINTIDTMNFFPSIGAKYVATKNSNVRFAFSQTMSRPMFREMAPIQYLPYFGGAQQQGNENLQNGYAYNADLKYELFPNSGEMIAVTVFGKYLYNPIERVRQEAGTPLITFINTDNAVVAGLELEVTKNLGQIIKADSGWTKNVLLGFNASYIYSQISIDTTNSSQGTINVTNVNRQLQGASPILLNADITYRLNLEKYNTVSYLTLSYNLSGKKITEAGVFGMPDIYENPINTLNFIWKNKIKDNFSVDFKVYNILNPQIKKTQEFDSGTEIVSSYQLGQTFAIKLGYSF